MTNNPLYALLIAWNGHSYYIAGPDGPLCYGTREDCERYIDLYIQ